MKLLQAMPMTVTVTSGSVAAICIKPTSTTPLRNDGKVFRLRRHGDIWGCECCKVRGDKFFLQDHYCNRSLVKGQKKD